MSSPPDLTVFDNRVEHHLAHITLERDPTTLMRLLELFAQRGSLPLRVHFDAYAGAGGNGRLRVQARMGRHDWRTLCQRAQTLVGVVGLDEGTPPGEWLPII